MRSCVGLASNRYNVLLLKPMDGNLKLIDIKKGVVGPSEGQPVEVGLRVEVRHILLVGSTVAQLLRNLHERFNQGRAVALGPADEVQDIGEHLPRVQADGLPKQVDLEPEGDFARLVISQQLPMESGGQITGLNRWYLRVFTISRSNEHISRISSSSWRMSSLL